MPDKDLEELEKQVSNLINLNKSLKESNENLVKKNTDLINKEQKLETVLSSSKRKLAVIVRNLKNKKDGR